MSNAPLPRRKRRFAIPLDLAVATLIMGTVLATGAVLAYHYYEQTSRLVLDASDNLFAAMGREVVQELARTTAPVQSLVDVFAAQSLSTAATPDERMRHLPGLVEALRSNPALTAVYVGYSDGAFFLVRHVRDRRVRDALRAPDGTAYVVQSVARSSGQHSASFHYLRADLSTIEILPRPDFIFDPRTRDWYRAAIGSDRQIRTDPYIFFTTQEPGITIARAARARDAVIGADVTLANLATLLRNQDVAPSTELFLLTGDGRVIARRSTQSAPTQTASKAGELLPTLAESVGSAIPPFAARFAADSRDRSFAFDASDRSWIGGFNRIDSGHGAPLYLAAASPTSELLAGAQRIRADGWIFTSLLLVAAVPLAWLTASQVSRPLRRLSESARAMQQFDFGDDVPVPSSVREIDRLASALADGKATVRRFLDVSGALAAERDIRRLVARVLDEVVHLAKAGAGAIFLFDGDRRKLEPVQALSVRNSASPFEPVPIDFNAADQTRTPTARAASSGETVLDDRTIAIPLRNRSGAVDGVLCLLHEDAAAAVSPHAVAFAEKISGVAAIAIEAQRLLADQKALLEAFIKLIAAAIDAKSPYTGGHCQRVPELTRMLAQAACDARDGPFRDFALDDDAWEAVRIASWLHDCGKVTTPEYVVDKATKLETIYDRIHEIRTRFEVLKRDAEIAFWKGRAEGLDPTELQATYERECAALDDDFAFVAACNLGGESMSTQDVERLDRIAARMWRRTLDDRIGVSWEEGKRMERREATSLPVVEPLLADKPEHIIERTAAERMPTDNRWGFKLHEPAHRYDRGELHNLKISRGTLTHEERHKINDHIVQTIIMLENLPFPRHLKNVPEIAGGHHEKMDGTGYPRGLSHAQMSPVARMMAIADIFEALTAVDRPYKKGKTLSEAVSIMARMRREQHIDADLFDLFLRAGVYRRYAERFLSPEQIDNVDIARLLAST